LIAVDTNILVYAHREDSPFYPSAARCITELAEGNAPWAIPWPCLHEFIAIVTHPRIYRPPTPLAAACDQVEAWIESPSLTLLTEAEGYWTWLRSTAISGQTTGPRVHDARIVAICRQHDVRELWSADRDFGRFPDMTVLNPLVR
jgi:toxin-antitoxin system PIN domain toxin